MQATSVNKPKADLLLEYDQNNGLDGKRKLQMTGNVVVSIICWERFQINISSYERHGLSHLSNVLFLVLNPTKQLRVCIVPSIHQRLASVSVPIHTVAPPSDYDKS